MAVGPPPPKRMALQTADDWLPILLAMADQLDSGADVLEKLSDEAAHQQSVLNQGHATTIRQYVKARRDELGSEEK